MPDSLIKFIRRTIKSVWALELLLHLKGRPHEAFATEQLVKDLRSSRGAIADALASLRQAGLVSEADGQIRYAPATRELDELTDVLKQAYVERPTTIIRIIVDAPGSSLQAFADAFRIKKDEP